MVISTTYIYVLSICLIKLASGERCQSSDSTNYNPQCKFKVFHQPFYTNLKTQAQSDLNCFAYQADDNTRIKKKTYTDFINRLVCPIYITASSTPWCLNSVMDDWVHAVVRENLEYLDIDCFSWFWQYIHREETYSQGYSSNKLILNLINCIYLT